MAFLDHYFGFHVPIIATHDCKFGGFWELFHPAKNKSEINLFGFGSSEELA